jgi:aerotaxis receptor
MDQVTQQNAALVEEAAAAATRLSEEAASLSQAVSLFNFGKMPPARRVPVSNGRSGAARTGSAGKSAGLKRLAA